MGDDDGRGAHDEAPSKPRCLFVHIMKTAGTSLITELRQVYPRETSWPPYGQLDERTDDDRWRTLRSYASLAPLLQLSDADRGHLRLVAGHVPLAAAELLCPAGEDVEELLCVTLLRDPVERTLSFLAQVRRDRSDARDMPLEEIYDDPWYFDRFIHNHQTRVLSMTLEEALAPRPEQEILPEFFRTLIPADARPEDRERLEHMIDHMELDDVQTTRVAAELDELGVDVLDALSADKAVRPRSKYWVPDDAEIYLYLDAVFARPSPVDAPRLMTARTHLEELAVVGLTSDYRGFIAELNHTLRVDCSPDARHNVSGTRHRDVSRSFARRIREDNALDAELVDAAYDLVAARTGRRPTVADDAPT